MQDFESQAEAFRTSIEQELRDGELTFPTALDVSLRIKQLADDPDVSLNVISRLVMSEPVLSARIVRMANTVAVNPYGTPISGVTEAVQRIGLSALRSAAIAVAAEQLAQDQRSYNMRIIASGLWTHSVDVACWAHAIARQSARVSPDAALLAGMMIDIAPFFLVARASAFPAMEQHIDRFAAFVAQWSEPVGKAILERFGLPGEVAAACAQGDTYDGTWPPASLADVVFVAQLASNAPNPIHNMIERPRRQFDAVFSGDVAPELVRTALTAARPAQQEMHNALVG